MILLEITLSTVGRIMLHSIGYLALSDKGWGCEHHFIRAANEMAISGSTLATSTTLVSPADLATGEKL